ncbi:Uncharacterised protein [Escherichia coli]|uniref:Uncharacterized protein n=1 Tax=Escherichia coli TaxID=562 RepID=A0A2X1K7G3_ECOLX|nr:Uncharacterised protein [Escherichia coli]
MAMNPTDTMKPAVAFCIHAGTDEFKPVLYISTAKDQADTGITWCNYLYGGKCFVDGAATICGLGYRAGWNIAIK